MAVDDGRGTDPKQVVRSPRPEEPRFRSNPATRAAVSTRLARLAPGVRVRQDGLWPFLLIRDFLGDQGRPRTTRELRQSPDILVVEGDVASLAGATPTDRLRANVPHTVFVHVWNLGRLPAIGVQLTVRAFRSPSSEELLGTRYLDLPDRTDPGCHAVFRLLDPFVPADAPNTQIRLAARVSCLLDLCGPAALTRADRHESERRVTVVAP